MEVSRIIFSIITAVISVVLIVYISYTMRGKGPILSNTYLWLTKEERLKADKKSEYKLVTVVFGCLSAIFALLSLNFFFEWKWASNLMWILIVFLPIYAIINAIKTVNKK